MTMVARGAPLGLGPSYTGCIRTHDVFCRGVADAWNRNFESIRVELLGAENAVLRLVCVVAWVTV